jgi:Bacterial Ig domain
MIRGSTGRFLTLILAPLFVIGATALVLLPGRGDDKVTVDADGPVVHIEAPASGSRYSPGPLTVVSTVNDPDGLSTAELRVEGKRVARVTLSGSSEETTQFTWTPTRAGEYELSVRARDLNGAWGAADEITVEIETDDVALPPPPTYASTTTVAATDPATAPPPADTGVALPVPVADPGTTSP